MPPEILKRPPTGMIELERKAHQREHDQRQADHQRQRRPGTPAPAGRSPPAACAPRYRRRLRRSTPTIKAPCTKPKPGKQDRVGQEQPAIVEIDAAGEDDAFAEAGQRLEHGVVPEQQLQQQRDIADGLDVTGGDLGHQPVAGQPRYADDETEDGGEHDAEAGHQQRIEQADPEGAAVSRGLRVEVDQRLADIEAGIVEPEAEAGGDMRACRIFSMALLAAP